MVMAAALLLGGCLETGQLQMLPDSAAVQARELPAGPYCTLDLGTDEIECREGTYYEDTGTYALGDTKAKLMPLDDGIYMYETYDSWNETYHSYAVLVTDRAFAELGVPADVEQIAARHGVAVDGGTKAVTDATRADYHAFLHEVAHRSELVKVTMRRDVMSDDTELRRVLADIERLAERDPPASDAPAEGGQARDD
ncbi:hypothetical protein [Fodinicurvata sediminis]|uniref:hypothetical protein n=1 Tax=Fodinicurvata sediminis TaxID=1121832 RepID=UPI0003B6CEB2|nr:hypothetical protein [Fodinicurvata sediminis]